MIFFSFTLRKSHSKPSFEQLAEKEIPILYRVAARMTQNATEAEDLVGQTLLAAVKSYDRFDGEYPRSWLIKILRNEHLMMLRKRNLRPETAIDQAAEPATEGYWKAIDWQVVGGKIYEELDRLPEEFRLAITLCDVEEMTREEAARALDIPVGTLGTRLFRGRNLLRSRLVRHLGELAPTQGLL